MTEIAVSRDPDEELAALGLGSCVGLVMLDRQAALAGLAHIVLPRAGSAPAPVGKYADVAVPELVRRLLAAGARFERLRVAIAGGASMFGDERELRIGERNVRAVNDALRGAGLRCVAAHTGGTLGRTLRVRVGSGQTLIRLPGHDLIELLPAAGPAGRHGTALRSRAA